MQNGAKRTPMPPSGPLSASKAASLGRPNSTHTTSRGRSEDVVPKVAFGRAVDEKMPGGKPTGSSLDPQKRNIMRAGGAATGKMLIKAESRAVAAREQLQQQRGRGVSPARPAAGGGFAKLQAKVSGPIVVSYDEEGRELKGSFGGNKQPRTGGALRSMELSGESEYLRIGGEEVDVISGDQLDRLLAKARRARGGRD